MRGAATKSMSDIVEERQQSRYAPFAAAPLRAAARRPAGFVARSSHTAPGIARRSRLASGPGGQQQSVHIISSQTLCIDASPMIAPRLPLKRDAGQAHALVPRALRILRSRLFGPPGVRFDIVSVHITAAVAAVAASPVKNE